MNIKLSMMPARALQLNQSDYIRKKILSDDYSQLIDQRDIHTIRMIGIVLPKYLN